jgi:hypothetical protein
VLLLLVLLLLHTCISFILQALKRTKVIIIGHNHLGSNAFVVEESASCVQF